MKIAALLLSVVMCGSAFANPPATPAPAPTQEEAATHGDSHAAPTKEKHAKKGDKKKDKKTETTH